MNRVSPTPSRIVLLVALILLGVNGCPQAPGPIDLGADLTPAASARESQVADLVARLNTAATLEQANAALRDVVEHAGFYVTMPEAGTAVGPEAFETLARAWLANERVPMRKLTRMLSRAIQVQGGDGPRPITADELLAATNNMIRAGQAASVDRRDPGPGNTHLRRGYLLSPGGQELSLDSHLSPLQWIIVYASALEGAAPAPKDGGLSLKQRQVAQAYNSDRAAFFAFLGAFVMAVGVVTASAALAPAIAAGAIVVGVGGSIFVPAMGALAFSQTFPQQWEQVQAQQPPASGRAPSIRISPSTNQTLIDEDDDGYEALRFNFEEFSDPDDPTSAAGQFACLDWTFGNGVLENTRVVSGKLIEALIRFPIGVTIVEAIVMDGEGLVGTHRVQVTVRAPDRAVLAVNPTRLDFGASAETLPLEITNAGVGVLEWELSYDSSYITIRDSRGSLVSSGSGSVSLTISPVWGILRLAGPVIEGSIYVGAREAGAATVQYRYASLPPDVPSIPNPPDGATNVSREVDLDWADTPNATHYLVYMGRSNTWGLLGGSTTSDYELPTLMTGTAHRWQVVAENDTGGSAEGPVWRFTTAAQATEPPEVASSPNPAEGAANVPTDADLDWSDAARANSYEVYFGMSNPPPFAGDVTSSFWELDQLQEETTYHWQIVARNEVATTPSPVWSFTTAQGQTGDGSIVAWGYKEYGQCDVPVPNEDFLAVAAGGHHSVGLKGSD